MAGIIAWARTHMPTRESIAANRFLAPFAHRLLHTSLWRFNRRSIPRAVALGLFVGPVVPVAHTLVAALIALPVRANLVLAIVTTWVINPLTIPIFYYEAYRTGRFLLHLDTVNPAAAVVPKPAHTIGAWVSKVIDVTGPAALGTIVLASAMAVVGYVASALIWRLMIARRWRRRARHVAAHA